MPKYVFELLESEFRAAMKGKEGIFKKLVNNHEDPVGFAFSCMRMGWMNKQYHADKQAKDKATMAVMKKLMENDPELKARLKNLEKDREL